MSSAVQFLGIICGCIFAFVRIETLFKQTNHSFHQLDDTTSKRHLSQHHFLNGETDEELILPRIDDSAPKSLSEKIAYCFYDDLTSDKEIKSLCSKIH